MAPSHCSRQILLPAADGISPDQQRNRAACQIRNTNASGQALLKTPSFALHLCFALSMQDAQWAYNRYCRMQHQQQKKFQGDHGNATDVVLVPLCTVRYPAAASQAIRSTLFWLPPLAGVHPSSPLQESQESPYPVDSDIGSHPMWLLPHMDYLGDVCGDGDRVRWNAGARYLTDSQVLLLLFNIPHAVGFIGLAVIHRAFAIGAHDSNAGTPTRL